jgi:hypothetical protein
VAELGGLTLRAVTDAIGGRQISALERGKLPPFPANQPRRRVPDLGRQVFPRGAARQAEQLANDIRTSSNGPMGPCASVPSSVPVFVGRCFDLVNVPKIVALHGRVSVHGGLVEPGSWTSLLLREDDQITRQPTRRYLCR